MQAQDDSTEIEAAVDDMFTFAVQHPFVSAYGGMSQLSLNGVSSIGDAITFGADLGFEKTKQIRAAGIGQVLSNSLYVVYHQAPDPSPESFSVQTWRFGARTGEQYGYQFTRGEEPGIYFGAERAPLSWYSIKVEGMPTDGSQTQAPRLTYFEDALRFGEASTATIRVRATKALSINAGFEWAQAYERHMFWFWAGSGIIEGVADGLASYFVKAIGKGSPGALPIMHFLIRNGIAMGFKALRKDQMNWPFTTEAPLNFMTFQAGISVVF